MRRSRRLSLRARMLVMLVAVTTVLLLIMGAVSTYLLSRLANEQAAAADKRLSAAATVVARDPDPAANRQLVSDEAQNGFAAVMVTTRPQLAVVPVTAGDLTDRLAAGVRSWLTALGQQQAAAALQQGHPALAAALLAGGGCQELPRAGCPPVQIAPGVDAVARVVSAAVADADAGAGGPAASGPATAGQATTGRAIVFVGQAAAGTGRLGGFVVAELVTGAALLALLVLGGGWLIDRGLVPLDEMTRTAGAITTSGDLTARMPDAGAQTEVGRLGAAINTMLDRIQHAFAARLRSERKVREFAADASHELRTPLTTIRGYAELYRQGALDADQLPLAMRRIEQEAERMSTLVAELLELARLDRTSSLDLAETDVAALARDAVADAVAVEPGRPVHADAPERLLALVDEARIRQVLANLLGNVRAHTPPGTPAVVRLGRARDGVILEVADSGPGMEPQDAARAFDRFHRAAIDTGATGGSGLGLSIVQAIAIAHGGQATLESSPGEGTTVRVWLPVTITA